MVSKKPFKRHKFHDVEIVKALMVSFFVFCFSFIYAQETIPASGGNATGSGGTASYSIGQIVYTTSIGSNGSVSQGVQQPYEISIIDGVEEAKDIALATFAYPNPTVDLLTLKVVNYNVENLSYALSDINGKLLVYQKIIGNETTIEMKNYPNAIYFLKVVHGEKEVKLFKIIKN